MEQIVKDLTTLTGLSEQDYVTLRSYVAKTREWHQDIIKDFYDTLFSYGPTLKVFNADERSQREETLRSWYWEVTSGDIESDFWQRQWTVGIVHIAKRVTNPFMFGMISRVQQRFLQKCLQELPLDEAEKLYGAFKRLTDTIAGLIAEGYFVNYIQAMEHVGGIKLSLLQRMIDLEINKKLQKIRTGK